MSADADPPGADRLRWSQRAGLSAEDYDARWSRMRAAGVNPHGEADFVAAFSPARVLDAGCGTGRVAIELARRGVDTVGVDIDRGLLERAAHKAPGLRWEHADLAALDLRDDSGSRERFDLVVLAGNVVIFLEPGSEPLVVSRLVDHLVAGGRVVAGFQLSGRGPDLATWDRITADAGLELVERHGGWHRERWDPAGGYAVSVHRLDPG